MPPRRPRISTYSKNGSLIARYYIQPGKPVQNAFIERFNRTYREEVLDADLFVSTQEVQQLSDAWLVTYNEHRPHDALGRVPPLTYLARVTTRSESNSAWSSCRGSLPYQGTWWPPRIVGSRGRRHRVAWGSTASEHRHRRRRRPNGHVEPITTAADVESRRQTLVAASR